MKLQTEFPHKIREIENQWIALSDGTKLAARLWLPRDAEDNPVPAILEYIPYRKRDSTASRDEAMHGYFAGHGYCSVRVDMRGSGDSEGLLLDEYLKQEQDDALEVIAWIAAQPWCTGRVGMMGKSWGGFNALQVAARQPSALTCIITTFSTTDRYADDIHYAGGALLTMNPEWAFTMFCRNARPPDPRIVGASWREVWRARLEANRPWIIEWLRHQRRDSYWKHGSVCEDFSAIRCPVYAIGGWADGYSNTVPRLLAGLQVPCKGLVGPWGHQYPHLASPGPKAGFLQEALRWWDHWLKGIDTGIMSEPRYQVWMQESVSPCSRYRERPGRWVVEDSWPSHRIETRVYALNKEGLSEEAGEVETIMQTSPQTVGITCPRWSNHGDDDGSADDPEDQRVDDARSIYFDSEPLLDPVEILGAVVVKLELSVNRPIAFVCVRLCDVGADGASTFVTYGVLNLTHDRTHEEVIAIKPHEPRRVEVALNDIAHRFTAGRRIRVAISTTFWPNIWPAPQPVALTLYTGVSAVCLPVRPPRAEDDAAHVFPAPESAQPAPVTVIRPASARATTVHREISSGCTVTRDTKDFGKLRIDRTGWEHGMRSHSERTIIEDAPLRASMKLNGQLEFGRADELDLLIEAACTMTANMREFTIKAQLDAYEDGQPFFTRSWLERIPRDGL